MENQSTTKIEFFKFKAVGEAIEGKVIALIQTQHGGAIELEIATDEKIYFGISTVGLKRIFKQAFLQKDIVVGKSVISVIFIEEVPLKNNPENSFCHYVLTGYRDAADKKSLFKYSTKEYELIDENQFIKFLD